MRLTERQVDLLAFEVARDLVAGSLVAADVDRLAEVIRQALAADLKVEDALDEEVTRLLDGYKGYMRANNVEYSEMFARIKKKLVTERKLVL